MGRQFSIQNVNIDYNVNIFLLMILSSPVPCVKTTEVSVEDIRTHVINVL